ncbi:MAG: hypothetical protein K0R17_105 [Rariglobus sp.]|jgi:uncharacterized protein YxjI|nr:hypothetical protein [Rariglobus sp.]
MLNRTQYFIREHAGLLKLSDVYDILDPQSQAKIGEAREEISGFVKFLRLFVNKSLMPTRIAVYEHTGESSRKLLFSLKRGFTFIRPKVVIIDEAGGSLGHLQSKLLSLGGAFRVFSADGAEIALVKGDWKGWNFRFLSGDTELGVVTKKWAGLGKELFTSADNYIVSINGQPSPAISTLLLAAGLAVDTVFKERK